MGFAFELGGTSSSDWVDAWKVVTDEDANLYVAGRFQGVVDFNPANGVSTVADDVETFQSDSGGSEPYDAFVAKYDSSSNFQWAYVFGGAGHQAAIQIGLDDAGNVFVLGDADDFTPSLRKLSQGVGGVTEEWARMLPKGSDFYAYSAGMAVDGTGNAYVEAHFGYGPAYRFDIFTYDDSGNLIATTPVSGSNVTATDLALKSDGDLLITGHGTCTLGATAVTNAFVAELDVTSVPASPSWDWALSLNSGAGVGIAESSDGAVLVTSSAPTAFKITRLEDTDPATPAPEPVWQTSIDIDNSVGSGYGTLGNGLAVDVEGGVYVGGMFDGRIHFGTDTAETAGERDVFIAKLDSSGNFVWHETAGDSYRQDMGQVALDSSGNIYSVSYGSGSFEVPTLVGGLATASVDLGIPIQRSGLVWKLSQDIVVDTVVKLDAGNLLAEAASAGHTDDTLTIATNGSDVRVTDPSHVLAAGAGATQVDEHTVDVPVSSITGATGIIVNTLGGDDTITFDATFAPVPARGVNVDAGDDTDTVNWNVTGALASLVVTAEQINLGAATLTTNGGAVNLNGKVALTTSVTIDTNSDNIGAGGAVTISTGDAATPTLYGKDDGVANLTLTIDTSSTDAAAGNVNLGRVRDNNAANAGDEFLGKLIVNAGGTTDGVITLTRYFETGIGYQSISVDGAGAAGGVEMIGTVASDGNTAIDTNQSPGQDAGFLDLDQALMTMTVGGGNYNLDASATGTGQGGDIRLGDFDDAGSGFQRPEGIGVYATDDVGPTGSITFADGNGDGVATINFDGGGASFYSSTMTIAPGVHLAIDAFAATPFNFPGNVQFTDAADTWNTTLNGSGTGNEQLTIDTTGISVRPNSVVRLPRIGNSVALGGVSVFASGYPIELHGDITTSAAGTAALNGDVTFTGNVVLTQQNAVDTTAGSSSADVALNNNSALNVDIGGTTPGSGLGFHEQLDVGGAIVIGSSVSLNTTGIPGFTPSAGQTFTIINNDGSDAVTGTFSGLPEGATIVGFLGSGLDATITYAGGDGNDVVINVQTVAVSITANDPNAAEPSDNGRFTVSLPAGITAPTGGLAVNYTVTGTAEGETDYTSIGTSATIPQGQNSTTIDVSVTDEDVVELDETVIVTLDSTGTSGYVIYTANDEATVTITNDDSATVSITGQSKNEGTGGTTSYTFDVDLSQPVDVAVSMTADTQDGSATAADDFTAVSGAAVSFAAGSTTTQTVTVDVDADSKVEPDEAFDLVLSALSAGGRAVTFVGGGATESAAADVLNDDFAPVANAGGPYTISEGDSLNLDASASTDADSTTLTYRWDVNGDGDYNENVTGETRTVTWSELVALGIDDGPDGPRNVTVEASDGTNVDTASTTLTVDNMAPTATLSDNGPITYGQTATVSFTDPMDPSTGDTTAGFHYAYSTTDDFTGVTYNTGSTTNAMHDFTDLDAGDYVIYARIIDKDDGYTQYMTTVNVDQRAITVTADSGQTKIYGESDPAAFTYQITTGTLVTGDSLSGALTRVAGENVGNYAIQQGTLDAGTNYTLTYVSADFTITQRPASVTPNPASKTYGQPDPVPLTTGTLSNFLAADGVTAVYSRTPGEAVGTYTISATLSPAGVLGNYNITYNTANLTITPVDNTPPVIVSLGISSPAEPVHIGETVTIAASFTDADTGDTHTAVIDWGDGTTPTAGVVDQAAGSVTGSHEYAKSGVFVITLTVSDGTDDAVANTECIVVGIGLNDGVLQIVGDDIRGDVTVTLIGDQIRVRAELDSGGTATYYFDVVDVDEIFAVMGDRNDDVRVDHDILVPVTLDGGAGNDFLKGGGGDDTIRGGVGNDKLRGDGGNDTIIDLEGNNDIRSGTGNDTITTGDGNDDIRSGDGDDVINAGGGRNDIHSGAGNDTVTTSDGNDTIYTDGGNDYIDAGDGRNEIRSGDGNDTVITGDGNDTIYTDGGNDTINAGNGRNDIRSGSGNDTIITGDGRDSINAGSGDDFIRAGGGNDEINAGSGNDIVVAGDGNDTVSGGAGRDLLIAGLGRDSVSGRGGEDIMIGGTTLYDDNDAALLAILHEWNSDDNYLVRIAKIRAGIMTPDGLVKLIKDETVFDDARRDELEGNGGLDWFFLADNEESRSDIRPNEESN